ncbi:hypothetical protein B0H10DRAFT_2084780 [Mycena sp. CBHHK59/15]|nr:hypothetical protein B0H10DRAFT_2084780 [Mycena sp. CBHHK59/15]
MRFATTLILPSLTLLTVVCGTNTDLSPQPNQPATSHDISLFSRWTSVFAFPASGTDATSQRVRRHGPRRRAVHP